MKMEMGKNKTKINWQVIPSYGPECGKCLLGHMSPVHLPMNVSQHNFRSRYHVAISIVWTVLLNDREGGVKRSFVCVSVCC